MKFQQLERAFWDKKFSSSSSSSSTPGFKRLRPLALTLSTVKPVTPLALKSFSFSKVSSTHLQHQHVSLQSGGGTRWNPTQEQIRKLELLYKSGMRTPNAHQIEKITAELLKHGRIEGKNVFYWFQNHKARERQKKKRNGLFISPTSPINSDSKGDEEKNWGKDGRSRRWGEELDQINGCGGDDRITLELFPLRPEKINENV